MEFVGIICGGVFFTCIWSDRRKQPNSRADSGRRTSASSARLGRCRPLSRKKPAQAARVKGNAKHREYQTSFLLRQGFMARPPKQKYGMRASAKKR